jgi:hypothetical protein
VSHVELIDILNPLSSSGRQTEEGNYRIETEKRCVICGNKNLEFVFQSCGRLAWDVCSELGICICNAHVTSKQVCILSRKSLFDTNLF